MQCRFYLNVRMPARVGGTIFYSVITISDFMSYRIKKERKRCTTVVHYHSVWAIKREYGTPVVITNVN